MTIGQAGRIDSALAITYAKNYNWLVAKTAPRGRPRTYRNRVLVFVTLRPQERIALELQAYLDGLTLSQEALDCMRRGSRSSDTARVSADGPKSAFVGVRMESEERAVFEARAAISGVSLSEQARSDLLRGLATAMDDNGQP